MTNDAGTPMKTRLRADLTAAMKQRNSEEAAVLRSLIAALDNAEAAPLRVESASLVRHDFHAGSAEVERRTLGEQRVESVIESEIAERMQAAEQFEQLGKTEHAEDLRRQAAIAWRYLEV